MYLREVKGVREYEIEANSDKFKKTLLLNNAK
jgi:hypothetical protein